MLGLVRDAAIAGTFGAGIATDSFFVAFKVPNLLRRTVAEGSLAACFVPVFTDDLARSRAHAISTFRSVLLLVILGAGAAAVLGMIYSPELTSLFAPGFSGRPHHELTGRLMRIMFPYVVLVSVLALAGAALNALGSFAAPAAAPALLNAVLICAVLFFPRLLEPPIMVLAVGVLTGGVLALLPQLLLLARAGIPLSPRLERSRSLGTLGRLMLPSMLSASIYQLIAFANSLLASLLIPGSISWLYYADRLFQFPLGIFTMAAATAVLPALARSAAVADEKEFGAQLTSTLCWITFLTVPASCGLFMLAEPIIATVYQRGSFAESSVAPTAAALAAYATGLLAISCHSVLVRAYLARKQTVLPAIVSCFSLAFSIALAFMLMGPPAQPPASDFASLLEHCRASLAVTALGHTGLAYAVAASAWFNAVLLGCCLQLVGAKVEHRRVLTSAARALLASSAMSAALYGIGALDLPPVMAATAGISVGIAVYFLASLILRSSEITTLRQLVRNAAQTRART